MIFGNCNNEIKVKVNLFVSSASIAFQWAPLPKDGDVIYACKGDDVTFPWAYTLSPGEEISSIEWLFHTEVIAMLSRGLFIPRPAYSGRVQQAANGGIVLSHVTTGDAGNYTVEVNVVGSANVFKHTVILHVNSKIAWLVGWLVGWWREWLLETVVGWLVG